MKQQPLLPSNSKKRTVILANGAYPRHQLPLDILVHSDGVVCCDGAAEELIEHGIVPLAIVGDCDSLTEELRQMYSSILHIDVDQETNDLTKAVKYCLSHNLTKITILGATGKREDHTLGNISLLAMYAFAMGQEVDVVMVSDYGIFTPICVGTQFESYQGQPVSVFGVDGVTSVTFEGLRYPLHDHPLMWWWQGSLNESLGGSFAVYPVGRAVVFRAFSN